MRISILLTVSTSLILYTSASFSNPPPNLTVRQKIWLQFNHSGAYRQAIHQDLQPAKSYLQQRIAFNNAQSYPQQLAIVLAINNTALNNYSDLLESHFSQNPAAILEEQVKGTEPAIRPVKQLYQFAIRHKIKVFFISQRHTIQQTSTQTNLRKVGYTKWQALYLLPHNISNRQFQSFATAKRALITNQGNKIVLNIGATQASLNGGLAERTILLPSYRNTSTLH